MTRWPVISFAYILEKKCDRESIWWDKDQKAYLYWHSGFVGPIYIHETCSRKIMCCYTLPLKHHKL